MQKSILLVIGCWLLIVGGITGCTTVPYTYPTPIEGVPGIYHHVEKGETLWRISQMYNIDLEELVRINKIYDPTKIEKGQLLIIPKTKVTSVMSPTERVLPNSGEDFIWPLKGRVIAKFGQHINNIINKGIDIQAPLGSDVVSSRSGMVTFYDEQLKGLGKTIIIDHGDNFLTVYARNSVIFVKVGDRVAQGKVIAKVGNAGRDNTSFLHFEIRKGHVPQNPYYYLP